MERGLKKTPLNAWRRAHGGQKNTLLSCLREMLIISCNPHTDVEIYFR